MARRRMTLTNELHDQLVKFSVKNPNLLDLADRAGIPVQTLQMWLKEGLMPDADPICESLVVALRRNRSILRGTMFELIVDAAQSGNTQWAAWVYDRVGERGEQGWESAQLLPQDQREARRRFFANPPPELVEELRQCGLMLVKDPTAPKPVVEYLQMPKPRPTGDE